MLFGLIYYFLWWRLIKLRSFVDENYPKLILVNLATIKQFYIANIKQFYVVWKTFESRFNNENILIIF